jgi:hypothetical protein
VPRNQVSRADAALIDALAAEGLHASPYQLERWRTLGLLKRNVRRGLGRGAGSTSMYDEGALIQARMLAHAARQGRALIGAHPIEQLARGHPVPEARVRSAFEDVLSRVSRDLGADLGSTDDAWQARHDSAAQAARGAQPLDWQAMFDLALGELDPTDPLAPEEPSVGAIATYLQALVAGEDVTGDDLLKAVAAVSRLPGETTAKLIETQLEAELLGAPGPAEELGREMSLAMLRDTLDKATVTDLQRAARAVMLGGALQMRVALIDAVDVLQPGTIPPELICIGRDELQVIRKDPIWHIWGRWQILPVRPRTRITHLAFGSLGLLRVPHMLDNVESYVERLNAAMGVKIVDARAQGSASAPSRPS